MSRLQKRDLDLFVSIIITTSDKRYKLLEKTLWSLRNQSYRNFEIILVCKKMTEQLKKMAQRYNAKLFEDKEKGRCYARNLGVQESIGEVIVFLDDDIELESNWLEVIIQNFHLNQIGGVGGVPLGQIDLGDVFPLSLFLKPFIFLFQIRQIYCWKICSKYKARIDFLSGSNMAFRKDVILKIGGFDENFYEPMHSEDLDLCLRVRKLGFYLIIDPRAKGYHKYHYVSRALLHREEPEHFLSIADNATYCRAKNEIFKHYLDWYVFFFHQVLRALILSIITKNKGVFFNYLKGVIKGYIRGKNARTQYF